MELDVEIAHIVKFKFENIIPEKDLPNEQEGMMNK
jgi:hypothetical protein